MKKVLLAVTLLLFVFSSQAQFTWKVKNEFPGAKRKWSAGFEVNGKAYLIGGCLSEAPVVYSNNVWEYNPINDIWTQKNNFVRNLSLPSYFTLNGHGYIVGGVDDSYTDRRELYQYDETNDTWVAKAPYPTTIRESFHFVINNKAYVGQSGMYEYDPTANSWTSKASYPGPHTINPTCFSIGNYGYAGLGSDGGATLYDSIYKYDPSNNTWVTIAHFPGIPRSGAKAFVLNNKAYVVGGYSYINGQRYELGDCYEYDPASDTWSAVPGMPGTPRESVTAFAINGNGYIVAGAVIGDNNYSKYVSEFGTCSALSSINPIEGNGNAKMGFTLFPNPSTDLLNVKLGEYEVTSGIHYAIISVDGKIIKQGDNVQRDFSVDVKDLSEGVYLFELINDKGIKGIERFEIAH